MFNVGDKVIVKTLEELKRDNAVKEHAFHTIIANEKYNICFNIKNMKEFCGKTTTIKNRGRIFEEYGVIRLSIGGGNFLWQEWMLKPFTKQLELFE